MQVHKLPLSLLCQYDEHQKTFTMRQFRDYTPTPETNFSSKFEKDVETPTWAANRAAKYNDDFEVIGTVEEKEVVGYNFVDCGDGTWKVEQYINGKFFRLLRAGLTLNEVIIAKAKII